MSRLELFNTDAKRVLGLAQDESRRFAHGYIGPEHLLLGILRDHDGAAARVLRAHGVDLVHAREALVVESGRGDPRQEFAELPLTPEADRVLDAAPAEAESVGARHVAPEHVLLSILREPGRTAGMLASIGASVDAIRRDITRGLGP